MQKKQLAIIIGVALASFAGIYSAAAVIQAVHYAVRADIAWQTVGAPEQLHDRAYRYFPFTYPVLDAYTRGEDSVRSLYALQTFHHFGGPVAHFWFTNALRDDIVLADASSDIFTDLVPFGMQSGDRERLASEALAKYLRQHDQTYTHFSALLLAQLGHATLAAIEKELPTADDQKRVALDAAVPYFDEHTAATADIKAAQRIHAACAHAVRQAYREPVVNRSSVDRAAEALTHGDLRAKSALQHHVNGDLRIFNSLSYGPNMIAVARAFPTSRLAQGFQAYDAIRGGTYFGRDDGPDEDTAPALGKAKAWREWLDRYADHPGADDASYWLGRALTAGGHRAGALRVYLEALERHLGDGDMRDVIASRVLFLLDVGALDDDLREYVQIYPHSSLTPLVHYALAVRAARSHEYAKALTMSTSLTSSAVERAVADGITYSAADVNTLLSHERALWSELSAASDASQEQAWASSDGWKIGYYAFFNGQRDGGALYANEPGIAPDVLGSNLQAANPNAQILAFSAQDRLHESTESFRRQRELRITALYEQLAEFPDEETAAMGMLASLPAEIGGDARLYNPKKVASSNPNSFEAKIERAQIWWTRQLISQVRDYVHDYPTSPFCATARLAAYESTADRTYLDELLKTDPHGPRSEEARALIWRDTTSHG